MKIKDLTGSRFKKLVVISKEKTIDSRGARWLCRCDCGNTKICYQSALRGNRNTSCGVCSRVGEKNNLVGRVFGRLTVLSLIERTNKKTYWLCKCDCERHNVVRVSHGNLVAKITTSCGCVARANARERAILRRKSKPGEEVLSSLYTSYRASARRKGIPFTLSRSFFNQKTKELCAYCGESPSNYTHNCYYTDVYVYNGLDKINPDNGYVPENCNPCCKKCNWMKGTLSLSQFKEKITKIHNKHFPFSKDSLYIVPKIPYKWNPAFGSVYSSYKRRQEKRFGSSFPFSMEEFYFLSQQECYYCGDKFYNRYVYKGSVFTYNGLDRKNSLIDYSKQNVVVCCYDCNRAKAAFDFSNFILHTHKLFERFVCTKRE